MKRYIRSAKNYIEFDESGDWFNHAEERDSVRYQYPTRGVTSDLVDLANEILDKILNDPDFQDIDYKVSVSDVIIITLDVWGELRRPGRINPKLMFTYSGKNITMCPDSTTTLCIPQDVDADRAYVKRIRPFLLQFLQMRNQARSY